MPSGISRASGVLRAVADFVLPPACPVCDGPADPHTDTGVCLGCRASLRAPPPPLCPRCGAPRGTGGAGHFCTDCDGWPDVLVAARSRYLHDGPAATLVWRLKYGGWPGLADWMGRDMAALVVDRRPSRTCVSWVPTTPMRRRIRGFDQAEQLAMSVARSLAFPLVHALERRGRERTQVALQPTGRLSNVKRAFSLREAALSRLDGAHVLLVDDVLTTGATATTAAVALEQANVATVRVITFARATPFRRARDGS